jgi:hypothetical protein
MGSEKYPYKGIIDHLANRGFSHGTNAWTDTDHTGKSFPHHHISSINPMLPAYTASTAGEQGFLQLLPIYLDHILYPTMTKAAFLTEVGSFSKLLSMDILTAFRFTTLTQRARIVVLYTVKCRAAKIRQAISWGFGQLLCYTIVFTTYVNLSARSNSCTLLGVPIAVKQVDSCQHLGFSLSSKVNRSLLASIPY